jgi:opacity protein-like surface antigen
VEAYAGGSLPDNSGFSFTTSHPALFGVDSGLRRESHSVGGHINPALIGGLKLGTWFVKEGFLGYNYPDWAKYFGFFLDFSYHRLDFASQKMSTTARDLVYGTSRTVNGGAPAPPTASQFQSEGAAATLAFMFAVRYGFLPDSEVPFGRLQPYVAVGPALLFSSQSPTISSSLLLNQNLFGYTIKPGSQSSTDICLAVEGGVRYMALKNVSLDVSFKYRYAAPTYTYTWTDIYNPTFRRTNTLAMEYNLFSFQCGAAYHF